MKSAKYQKRFYRNQVKAQDLYRIKISVKETDLDILSDKPLLNSYLREKIYFYRRCIENYIAKDKKFLTSLKPISVELRAPLIVRQMAEAGKKANVGPMAAVAGALAESLGKDLLRKGCKEIIIENGGDIFCKITKERKVGIYAGKSNLWKGLKLKIKPEITPLGICTSSGTIGHSLSFGCADSVAILSKNTALADAVATAVGNLVQGKGDLKKALDFARSIKGVLGAVIILKNNLASWGKVEFLR